MTSQQRERILQALWPQPGPPAAAVWAILDCARDPQIYRALLASWGMGSGLPYLLRLHQRPAP